MTLKKSVVPIVLGNLDNITDKKLVVPGSLLEAENCFQYERGKYEKRLGFNRTASTKVFNSVHNFKDSLLGKDNSGISVYSKDTNNWIDIVSKSSTDVELDKVFTSNGFMRGADRAVYGDIECVVYCDLKDATASAKLRIRNTSTKILLLEQTLSTTGYAASVCVSGNTFLVVFNQVGTIYAAMYDVNAPIQSSFVNVANADATITDPNDLQIFAYQNAAIFAYRAVSGAVKVGYITRSGQLGTSLNGFIDKISIAATLPGLFSLNTNGVDLISVVDDYGANRNTLRCTYLTPALTVVGTPATATMPNAVYGTMPASYIDTFGYTVVYSSYSKIVKRVSFTASTASAPTTFLNNVNAFVYSTPYYIDGNEYVHIMYKNIYDDNQTRLFIFKTDVNGAISIVGQIVPTFGNIYNNVYYYGIVTNGRFLTRISTDGNFSYSPVITVNRNAGIANSYSDNGVSVCSVDTAPALKSVEMQDSIFFSGSIMQKYDGNYLGEANFLLYPEAGANSILQNAGTGIAAGSYLVAYTYEWTDINGRRDISATGVTTEVVASTILSFTYTFPSLTITQRVGVKCCVYRSQKNGTVLYKVAEIINENATRTVTEAVSDANLLLNEALYTAGGVLENGAIGGPVIAVVKNRIFSARNDVVSYSKQNNVGDQISFPGEFYIQLPYNAKVTSIQELDDKILVFSADKIFVIQGDGPNVLGEGNFSEPFRVSADVGCKSVSAVYKDGIIFQSSKGIYQLSRGLQTEYIGANVQQYNGLTVTDIVIKKNDNIILLFTEDKCLVFNYLFQQWTVFTNADSKRATEWLGRVAFCYPDGTIAIENEAEYSDSGSHITMKISTSWLSLNNLMGFQRVYFLQLLGQYEGLHQLKVQLRYDFNETIRETFIKDITQSGFYGDGVYGATSFFGDSEPINSIKNVYQYQMRPMIQKCECIKMTISDMPTLDNELSKSFSLNAVTVCVGGKYALNKVGNTNKLQAN